MVPAPRLILRLPDAKADDLLVLVQAFLGHSHLARDKNS